MSIASLYPSINPSLLLDFANSKVLDPRITFTRTTTAAYYDGVTTAVAEQNLLTYSQEFDNAAWSKTSGSVTANADNAPDGTSTADLFTPSASDARIQQSFFPTGAVQCTCSVWLRSATGSSFSTDLLFWRVSPFSSIATTTITVTTTWQRFTLTATALDATAHAFVIGGGGSLTTGENVYMWGAQAEIRSSATAYTATTTQAITNYIPVLQTAAAGQARFDHNPTTGESLGLLIEEASTNVATYSEDFGNAAWNKGGNVVAAPVVTINQVIAPNGTLTGDQVDLPAVSGASAFSIIYYPFTASASAYTGSFYLKGKNGGEQIWINFTKNGVNYTQTLCTLTTSWQRFSLSSTLTAGADNLQIGIDLRDSAESAKSAQTFFIWGAQLENKSFATSYIPNLSTGSTTRNADAASMTGTNFSSWFNNGEGTVYAENSFIGVGSSSYPGVCKFSDGTVSNRFGMYGRPSGAGYGAVMTALGSTTASLEPISGSTATAINTYSRLSYGYKVNDFGATRNASTVTTDTSGNVAVGVNQLNIGLYDEYMNGTIKKLAYYPIKATSTQLQSLTV